MTGVRECHWLHHIPHPHGHRILHFEIPNNNRKQKLFPAPPTTTFHILSLAQRTFLWTHSLIFPGDSSPSLAPTHIYRHCAHCSITRSRTANLSARREAPWICGKRRVVVMIPVVYVVIVAACPVPLTITPAITGGSTRGFGAECIFTQSRAWFPSASQRWY